MYHGFVDEDGMAWIKGTLSVRITYVILMYFIWVYIRIPCRVDLHPIPMGAPLFLLFFVV